MGADFGPSEIEEKIISRGKIADCGFQIAECKCWDNVDWGF
jgi:hypothetical protein